MFKVKVKFRDENGKVRRGELANPFQIMVEGLEEVLYIDQENPTDIAVITRQGAHQIPMLAVEDMWAVALA